METRLRLLLVGAGLPDPAVQYEVVAGGQRYRLDLAYPGLRLAIEYDGDHHRERETFRRDVARLNALRTAGWTVLRFTAADVLRHPERVVVQVRTVLTGG
jgi:very-short-patch-repair endonuclease